MARLSIRTYPIRFAANEKNLRETWGLSEQEMGEVAGVRESTVIAWEKGALQPTVDAAARIGTYFDIHPAVLLFEDEVELTPDEERFIEDFRMASAEEQAAIRRRLIRSANGGVHDTRRSDDNRFDTAGEAALRNLPQR